MSAGTASYPHSEGDRAARLAGTRALSRALVAPLGDADASAQSMPDASPAKWHLAHTSWFFESFVLRELAGYRPFDPAFAYLFNSYYEAEGARLPRAARGLLTRPSLESVLAYRDHVDEALLQHLDAFDDAAWARIELGIQHEQQHQELLLTDILHLFAQNPIAPVYDAHAPRADNAGRPGWQQHPGGIQRIGPAGDGFAYDCEQPAHAILLHPFRIARALVSNAEWQQFIDDGGYETPTLWLSDGWAWVQRARVEAPLYWHDDKEFTLAGLQPRDSAAPVAHVSYYEADAFARWAGQRLPREAEWEVAAQNGLLDAGFGQLWQWTASSFAPYPGFRAQAGALGEYNGKFMCGQMVLRGSSVATPAGHARTSYRNFFYPQQRWQFSGVRLASDAS